jgi:transcriptional regulator with XRE-family HTH domain
MPKVSDQSDPHVAQADFPAQTIPTRIKMLREAVGLTAVQLDRLTSLCAGTIGRLERGDQKVYASHLFRIAQATGVDIGWFYGEPTADTAMPSGTHALEQRRLLDAYLRIGDPGLKRDVFELIEALANDPSDQMLPASPRAK